MSRRWFSCDSAPFRGINKQVIDSLILLSILMCSVGQLNRIVFVDVMEVYRALSPRRYSIKYDKIERCTAADRLRDLFSAVYKNIFVLHLRLLPSIKFYVISESKRRRKCDM